MSVAYYLITMVDNCVPQRQLGSCSVTRPFLSLVWLARLVWFSVEYSCFTGFSQVEGSPRVSSTSSPKASSTKSSQKKPAKAPVVTGTKQEEEGVGAKGRGKKAKANRAAVENEPEKLPKEEENEGQYFNPFLICLS